MCASHKYLVAILADIQAWWIEKYNTTYKGNIKGQTKVVCCCMSVGYFLPTSYSCIQSA
jgi:hypothetical protein